MSRIPRVFTLLEKGNVYSISKSTDGIIKYYLDGEEVDNYIVDILEADKCFFKGCGDLMILLDKTTLKYR